MILKGKVVWSDGLRMQISVSNNKWKSELNIYSDFNPDRLKPGDRVQIEIKKAEAQGNE